MGEVIILASFTQNINCKYGVGDYQSTKNTYDWIVKVLNQGGFQNLKVETRFLFHVSEILYNCENIEEFVEYAYGQENYRFTSMDFRIKSEGISLWFISVDSSSQVSIRTDTKNLLESVVSLLRNISLDKTEENDPISVVYIEHQDNSVTIKGDRNMVANNHSAIVDKQEKAESKTSKWLQGICQGVLANGVWKLLGILAAIIIAYIIGKTV